MAVTERNSRRRILLGESNNALFNLVAINAVIYVALIFTSLVYRITAGTGWEPIFQHQIVDWVVLPSDLSALARHPWTLLTGMFVHTNVWMVICNMVWLWAFGYIMQDLTGNGQIIPLYIYGGLAGGIIFVLSSSLVPALKDHYGLMQLAGANTAILSVAVATTMVSPDYRIFPMINGGIPLWVLTIIFVAIDFAGLGSLPFSYHLSHIAGAAMGFVFVKQFRAGRDWGAWMHRFYDWTINLANPNNIKERKVFKKELFYKSQGNPPYKKTPLITQQKVDELLDKISQKGYGHLTDEEQEILKRASEGDL